MSGTELIAVEANGLAVAGAVGSAISAADRGLLRAAAARLEQGPGLLVRLADSLGGVVGRTMSAGARGLAFAPGLREGAQAVAAAALRRAMDVAVIGLGEAGRPDSVRRPFVARAVVLASGAAGGFAGLAGFVPDAAVTTLTIMREIGAIARDAGESLADEDTRRACLEVFAFGGAKGEQEELGYLTTRLMLQGRTLASVLGQVSSRYSVALGQKFGLQAIPVLGALGGAALNSAFLSHYREIARAHFTVRRLERLYGREAVRDALAGLPPVRSVKD